VALAGVLAALAGCGGAAPAGPQRVRVEVTGDGFVPATVAVRRGRPVVITFERTTDRTCGTDVVFPALHKGFDLPLHKPVPVSLAAAEVGDTLKFNCSMDMLHGMLVAK
jgi:plastocyanin domain-containing protein